MMTNSRTVYAPAKVNLCLHVEGRREDGYHELCTIMQKISLCDELTLTLAEGEGVELDCDQVPLAAGEDNLVVRAARLMLVEVRRRLHIDLRLTKNIPIAAGLGGGSSDAASVLLTLNQLLGEPVAPARLAELGLQLGADVPFFLQDDTVWARGVGEKLAPVAIAADYVLLLVNPQVPVSTAVVYQGLDRQDFSRCDPVTEIIGRKTLCRMLHNDLERVAIRCQPVIAEVKKAVAAWGAEGVLMSGSGATVFGVFATRENADNAAKKLRYDHGWWCEVVCPL